MLRIVVTLQFLCDGNQFFRWIVRQSKQAHVLKSVEFKPIVGQSGRNFGTIFCLISCQSQEVHVSSAMR